jgi:hypothetical protein
VSDYGSCDCVDGWRPHSRIELPPTEEFDYVQFATNGDCTLLAAWVRVVGAYPYQYRLVVYERGGETWSRLSEISSTGLDGGAFLAMSKDGNIIAAIGGTFTNWSYNQGTKYINRYERSGNVWVFKDQLSLAFEWNGVMYSPDEYSENNRMSDDGNVFVSSARVMYGYPQGNPMDPSGEVGYGSMVVIWDNGVRTVLLIDDMRDGEKLPDFCWSAHVSGDGNKVMLGASWDGESDYEFYLGIGCTGSVIILERGLTTDYIDVWEGPAWGVSYKINSTAAFNQSLEPYRPEINSFPWLASDYTGTRVAHTLAYLSWTEAFHYSDGVNPSGTATLEMPYAGGVQFFNGQDDGSNIVPNPICGQILSWLYWGTCAFGLYTHMNPSGTACMVGCQFTPPALCEWDGSKFVVTRIFDHGDDYQNRKHAGTYGTYWEWGDLSNLYGYGVRISDDANFIMIKDQGRYHPETYDSLSTIWCYERCA